MQTPVRRFRLFLFAGLALGAGCTADNTSCGGPTSDWPFCRSGGSPTLSGDGADGEAEGTGGTGAPGGLGDGVTTGGAAGATTGTTATTGGTGSTTGGGSPTLDNEGPAQDAGAGCSVVDGCLNGLTGGSSDGAVEDANTDDCGEPLECDLESELDSGAVFKTFSGDPPLELTHASFAWAQGPPQGFDIFLRALDASGHEVRLAIRLDEATIVASQSEPVSVQPELTACGEADPPPLEVEVQDVNTHLGIGFGGVVRLSGEGWSAEVVFATPNVCPVD